MEGSELLKASPIRILLGLFLGAAVGYFCTGSSSTLLSRVPGILAPIGTLFINAIRVCVIPLVCSSLIVGCASSQDASRVGRLAGKSLALMVGYLFLSAAFAGALAFPTFRHFSGLIKNGAQGISNTPTPAAVQSGAGEWIGNLIPSNIFKSAADGALLPLIVFSIAFGITISRMPSDRRLVLLQWFQALTDAFTRLIDAVLWTAPIGVFCLAANLAAAAGLGAAGALFSYVVMLSLVSGLFVIAVLYPSVAIFASVPFATFLKAAAPAQALAFTSRSSLAALPATYQAAQELTIPEEVSSFFFPFAASIFRVGGCIAQVVGICFLATFYGVSLSSTQLAMIIISAVAVSLTVPGIPGGAIIVMTPILTSVGIPLVGMAMLLAVDTIPDMFRTLANVTGWLSTGVILSSGHLRVASSADLSRQADRTSIS
jgi:proton glutamate symport protein